jgi:ribosomal protein S18 acetylase RimI-like enzyme
MIEIRPCRLEECAAVLAMWARAGAIPSPTDTLEEVNHLVREHADSLLLAIRQGSIVGSVIGGWDGWRGNIYRLAVAPEARRAGLARRLVDAAERMLVSKGARRFSALVERHEVHAVGFWDALADRGWHRDERMMRYIKMA